MSNLCIRSCIRNCCCHTIFVYRIWSEFFMSYHHHLLIDLIAFYVILAIFQPYDNGYNRYWWWRFYLTNVLPLEQVMQFIESGERLSKPEDCPDTCYRKMRECWNKDPARRPNFNDLYKHFLVDQEYASVSEIMQQRNKAGKYSGLWVTFELLVVIATGTSCSWRNYGQGVWWMVQLIWHHHSLLTTDIYSFTTKFLLLFFSIRYLIFGMNGGLFSDLFLPHLPVFKWS